jgi:hypothetical protein
MAQDQLVSQLKKDNLMEAVDIKQLDTFNAALLFAKRKELFLLLNLLMPLQQLSTKRLYVKKKESRKRSCSIYPDMD